MAVQREALRSAFVHRRASAMEGDDIDTETLQSQIDLSMSLVHNLVSSWMKPSQKASIVSSNTAQKELEEYMRRPPRYAHTFSAKFIDSFCLAQARGWSTYPRNVNSLS